MVEMFLVVLIAIQFVVIINLIDKVLGNKESPVSKIKKAIRRKRKSKNKIGLGQDKHPTDTEATEVPKVESW